MRFSSEVPVAFYVPYQATRTLGHLVLCSGGPRHGWEVRTGPFGKSALPPGQYDVGIPTLLNEGLNVGFYDKFGLGWWVRLTPQFETKRTGLGMHPDGNVPGTLGCLGFTLPNTQQVFDDLAAWWKPGAQLIAR